MNLTALKQQLSGAKSAPKGSPLAQHAKRLRKALQDGDDTAVEAALLAALDAYHDDDTDDTDGD